MAVAAFVWGAAGAASAQPAKVPVEAFFQNPAFTAARLSPSGKHVAATFRAKTGRIALVVMDTANLADAKVVGGFSDADVWRFEWVNDGRLVFSMADMLASQAEVRFGTGMFAVDRDGGDFRQLTEVDYGVGRRVGGREFLHLATRLHSVTRAQDSDDVFVLVPEFADDTSSNRLLNRDLLSYSIARLNTRTRALARVNRPGRTWQWVVDAKDVPRAAVTSDKGKAATHYLDPATGQWQQLNEFDAFRGNSFAPVAVTPDGSFYVSAATREGTEGLFRFDLAKRTIDPEAIVSVPKYDFRGQFIMDSKRLLGLRYTTDAESTVWFDPKLKELQAKVDAQLKATVNRLDVPTRPEAPFVLVHAYSDVEPGRYMLYHTETGELTPLGAVQPTVDPKQMAHRELVRYKARDGLEIPAWLTVPHGAKGRKLPMVVLVHGGPWIAAQTWRWDADSQFLASRGYAVLEPQFRGTLGLGFNHFKASWKQWGLAMQDDIADGARWAIAQGIADPQKVCIAGASYGGYSTLMGLVRDPDLYKCGVSWAAVTDIELMHTVNWSDFSEVYKTYGMPVLVGDPKEDTAQLEATSPIKQAAKIRKPLLLAHGGTDRRVPITHGIQFRDAVQKTNPDVEWIEYTDEGHGWALIKNRVDFWTRVEKFLARHIGAQ
ncbi:hypothetical protein UC35_01070 [Ramlibacter tataouinensis]|uniref:Peptidase S9 prolyl oligopeptidase catalytic domain-containing protein n=1 Tax=Ramlibacter tataouinensis TaxID=94132 RepID=A0A127JYY8_9BURK|nr:hypothetical protein UC35_01070 [Ramlibacter tataouinensis]